MVPVIMSGWYYSAGAGLCSDWLRSLQWTNCVTKNLWTGLKEVLSNRNIELMIWEFICQALKSWFEGK
jgi:hypothetical protein